MPLYLDRLEAMVQEIVRFLCRCVMCFVLALQMHVFYLFGNKSYNSTIAYEIVGGKKHGLISLINIDSKPKRLTYSSSNVNLKPQNFKHKN
jgi:hypothetical protein